MNEKRAWQRVANMEKRTKNYRRNVKQECIKNIAKGILKNCRVPVYEKDQKGQVLTDQNGDKIPKMRSYKIKNGQRKTHVKTRKLLGFDDFKKHFAVIPKRDDKKVVKIVELITKINELKSKPTDLNEMKNRYSKELKSLESSPDDSNQSDHQPNNTDSDSNINDDQNSQNDPNNSDSSNSDEEKNQDSDYFNFDNPNPDFSNDDDPGKMPGDN